MSTLTFLRVVQCDLTARNEKKKKKKKTGIKTQPRRKARKPVRPRELIAMTATVVLAGTETEPNDFLLTRDSKERFSGMFHWQVVTSPLIYFSVFSLPLNLCISENVPV